MIVSGVQQSDSVIHVTILFQILFSFRLLHNIEQSSLCYTVGPCWLSILSGKLFYKKFWKVLEYCFQQGWEGACVNIPEPGTCGSINFFLKFIYLFYLFLAVLGLRFCARAFSSCGKRGPLFIAVRGPFTVAASLVAGHRLQMHRVSSCGSRA